MQSPAPTHFTAQERPVSPQHRVNFGTHFRSISRKSAKEDLFVYPRGHRIRRCVVWNRFGEKLDWCYLRPAERPKSRPARTSSSHLSVTFCLIHRLVCVLLPASDCKPWTAVRACPHGENLVFSLIHFLESIRVLASVYQCFAKSCNPQQNHVITFL